MTTKQVSGESTQAAAALSEELVQRLLEFVAFKPNWDGHDGHSVPVAAASRAYALARAASTDFGEPFVAPCGDGSLLLQWDQADLSIETFALPSGELGPALITAGDSITEAVVVTDQDVMQLLAELQSEARRSEESTDQTRGS